MATKFPRNYLATAAGGAATRIYVHFSAAALSHSDLDLESVIMHAANMLPGSRSAVHKGMLAKDREF